MYAQDEYVGFDTGNGGVLNHKQSQARPAAWVQLNFSPFQVLNPK